MAFNFYVGEPYKSPELAFKAKRSALLQLCVVMILECMFVIFMWWVSVSGDTLPGVPDPTSDVFLLLILATVLYYRTSRIGASLLLILAGLELVFGWYRKIAVTGEVSPPGIALLLAVLAANIANVVFRTYQLEQKNNLKPQRSKLVLVGLILTLVFLISAVFVPVFHFVYYTEHKVELTQQGEFIKYYGPLDRYSFEFPQTWKTEHPAMEYGNVNLNPVDDSDVTVRIERWSPWSIAPLAVNDKKEFLKMVRDEAAEYSDKNNVNVDSVELMDPSVIQVNKAWSAYTGADGSKMYVYYVYDKAWSRQTSKASYFFWRLTANIPINSLKYEAEAKSVLQSFKINQSN